MSTETSIPLLTTKLNIPPQRPHLVSRPALIARLNQGLELGHILTLISAPAGFGKTTLVSEWVGQLRAEADTAKANGNRIAWLSLDEADSDIGRFLTYLLAAVNRVEEIEAAIGQGTGRMRPTDPLPPTEEILTALINEIATLDGRIVFVLDDYHLIDGPTANVSESAGTSPDVHSALNFLLEHIPPQLHLVIVTRSDPDLSVARHRARGQLTEMRAADLRFSSAEVTAFLNNTMGLSLSPEEIATLETRTEGWIAGLQLAAVSMQGRDDSTGFIKSFAGSHRFVVDYLVEEVLKQQTANVQTFLLRTAILNKLSGPLCDAVSGQNEGQETLQMLERANLFLVRLDEERHWYRYHQLFSDLLRRRLRQTRPESVAELHRRAGEWYRQNGYAREAIEHALRAKDFEWAADLLEEHIDALWGRGENRKLQNWLDSLPEEILFARPTITVFQARYQCNSGLLDAAERTLEAAVQLLAAGAGSVQLALPSQRSLTDADRMRLQGRVEVNRALLCSYQGDVPGIIQHANRALAQLPAEDLTWRSVTAILLGNAHGFQGNMTAAYEARFEALQACEAAGDIYFIILANLEVAITLREQGQLQRTIEICRRQLQIADANRLSQSRTVGWLLAIWGETLAELGELDEALGRAQEGFALSRRGGDMQMLGWSFMCLARVLLSRGDLTGTEDAIKVMEDTAREYQMPPWIADQVAAWQARLWLAQGRLQKAVDWAQVRDLNPDEAGRPPDELGFFRLFDYIILARILIAQGRPEEANSLLPHLLAAAETGGRTSSIIEIKILQALAFQALGQPEQALSALEVALTRGEPTGFIRIFVDEGPPLARLLYRALQQGTAPEYVQRLLVAFPDTEPARPLTAKVQAIPPNLRSAIVEPLSERERQVLQHIAEGLTNRQIAERLYLSLHTVKAHTRNLYGKLDVHSRTQAVARARELGILPSS